MKRVLFGSVLAALVFSVTPAIAQNDFYVANGGVDAGDCANSAVPCATITYTTTRALSADAHGNPQTIHLAAGGWNESVKISGASPHSGSTNSAEQQLIFDGAGSTLTTWNGDQVNCGTLIANYAANVSIENLTIEAEGNKCQSALFAQMGGLIQVDGGVIFGPAWQQQMHAENAGSQIQVWNSYTISGGLGSHIGVASGGMVEINPANITATITGTPAFSTSFIQAMANGVVYIGQGTQFIGSITGAAYDVWANGTIYTSGMGCPIIPGTAGSASTNGVCQ